MSILEIQPAEIAANQDPSEWIIIDVREGWELAIAKIGEARHIPLGELPSRLDELPTDGALAILCHSGVRSARATQFLNNSGFTKVYNIVGGIDRWSVDVDPTIARY